MMMEIAEEVVVKLLVEAADVLAVGEMAVVIAAVLGMATETTMETVEEEMLVPEEVEGPEAAVETVVAEELVMVTAMAAAADMGWDTATAEVEVME